MQRNEKITQEIQVLLKKAGLPPLDEKRLQFRGQANDIIWYAAPAYQPSVHEKDGKYFLIIFPTGGKKKVIPLREENGMTWADCLLSE